MKRYFVRLEGDFYAFDIYVRDLDNVEEELEEKVEIMFGRDAVIFDYWVA